VRDLSVTYANGFTAVRNASFDLDPGTICALVGVNGSGKSTIFKAIMGFVKPSRGEVRLCGLPVAEALRRNIVAYVPQSEDVDWNFPVLVETVVMMGRYGHVSFAGPPGGPPESCQALSGWISDYRDRQIGELRRPEARVPGPALAQEGSIILLSRPTDDVGSRPIIDLLREPGARATGFAGVDPHPGSVPTATRSC
jgi:manganese/iron transport system ATP-binding protein